MTATRSRSFSLRTKFLIGTVTIILAIGVAAVATVRPVLHRQLQDALERNGLLVASHVASHSITPLLTENYIDLDMMTRDLMHDSGGDIRYFYYVDRNNAVVSHTFRRGFPSELKDTNPIPPGKEHALRHLLLGDEKVFDIAVPVLNGQIGTLHVGFSEDRIERSVNEIVRWVTGIIIAVLMIGIVIVVVFDAWVVRPLRNFTNAVTAAGQGNRDARLPVRSGDELGQLARSFNEAFERRDKAEAERESIIAELNTTLGKVKQLSGMLPICSSCKKIRDDKGYWSQIEGYIRDHSEAEFSHGICPECAQKLYPQYLKEK